MSQLLTASLDAQDGECFNKLFVSLHKSQLLTTDVLIKVSWPLTCSLTLCIESLGFLQVMVGKMSGSSSADKVARNLEKGYLSSVTGVLVLSYSPDEVISADLMSL